MPSHLLQFSSDKKPVVVWNITRRCNLHCIHCYSNSIDRAFEDELSTAEAVRVIDDLADYGVPVVLFSGGEPLMRPDVFDLIFHARERGLRTVLSTNGTLLTAESVDRLRKVGLSYVGISIDGMENTHDLFRGVPGAFQRALQTVRSCISAGLKVGLRFTITRRNIADVNSVFDLIARERIPRICFYHLVYTGRGLSFMREDLSHEETRQVVDLIMDRTAALHRDGFPAEVLTVDNHCDGPYLYMRMLRENSPRAEAVLELLRMNGGNNSGIGIACISWDGTTHPDQFWRHYAVGNVRQRPFSEIWSDNSEPLLVRLRNRRKYIRGRCTRCRWLDVCNCNLRVRAEAAYGDPWGPDPACYLTDAEIAPEAELASLRSARAE